MSLLQKIEKLRDDIRLEVIKIGGEYIANDGLLTHDILHGRKHLNGHSTFSHIDHLQKFENQLDFLIATEKEKYSQAAKKAVSTKKKKKNT